ncbi:hypothetical protein OR1_01270 [Geobacter sp. OR-1]|uniref:hypothetical protein n=1 Tax=Geobacter sp. OR-1 TaxID=1266765 RepID=UPI0005443CC1|nr:hypothetical protein [Geobacter sp. OR-1]GAM08996.1 hypothetical protein OR1_01270 [Geobacter sp. OR-1]
MNRVLSAVVLALILAPAASFGFGNMAEPQWNPANPSASAPQQQSAPQPVKPSPDITGRVVQTINSGGYSYVLMKQKDGKKIWVAAPELKVNVGEQLTFEGGMEMVNFQSSTLKRTFDKVIFSNGLAKGKEGKGKDAKKESRSPGSMGAAVAVTDEKVKVKKATGKNAYTITEVFKKKDKLKNKQVVINAKVVKVSSGIMNKNWIHLQDGTGSHMTADNDLVVTSDAIPIVGDLVTVKGKLETNKDFGGGYKYNVIIEKANITIQ